MRRLLLIFFVLSSVLVSTSVAIDCRWVQNVDARSLPTYVKKKYLQCLFETIENRTLKNFKENDRIFVKSGKKKIEDILGSDFNPLKLPPDAGFITGTATSSISIVDAEIRQANVFTTAGTADIEGYLHLKWKDPRLTWSTGHWKLSQVTPSSFVANKLWYPLFNFRKPKGKGSSQASELIPSIITSTGTVTASIFMDWECKCTMDTRYYPSDKASCTVSVEGTWVNTSKIVLVNKVNSLRPSNMYKSSYYWQFQSAKLETRAANNKQYADITVNVRRINPSGHIEILTPILIATIIAIMAPLFGGFKWQSIIKVVALLFMYLSLISFVRLHWVMRHAPNIPKLLEFHRYSMVVTLIALLVSLGLWTIARKSPTLPPPHWLITITDKLPSCCLCLSTPKHSKDEGTEATTESQWADSLSLINCLSFFVFLVVYIIGIVVYCT